MGAESSIIDCCVIGSGPAGLQAGYLLKQKGISFRILEKGNAVNGFFRQFPRHRTLISINKATTGLSNPDTKLRYDWNSLINDEGDLFTDRTRTYFPNAEDYVSYLDDFAQKLEDDICLNSDVSHVSKDNGTFTLRCADGTVHQARHVIVATGVSEPWSPDVEGFDLVDNYFDCDLTPERFDGKRVLVIGKGNSAFETADALCELTQATHVMSPNKIRFAWKTHFVGHLRAVNNNFLDTYQLKSQNAVLDAEIEKIELNDGVYTVTAKMQAAEDHTIILNYDHIIACTGFRFNAEILDKSIRPELHIHNKFPKMTAQWESENVENLYFAGTIMQSRDYRKTMSGFVHGFRHNVQCLTEFIAQRLGGTDYPHQAVGLDEETVTKTIINRISLSSGMFLQPAFLGDSIMLSGRFAGQTLHDAPVEWMCDAPDIGTEERLQITLEFGDFGEDAFHVKRQHTVFGQEPDPFIHPVVRHFKGTEFLSEVHLSDHLDADWRPIEERDAGAGTVQQMTFHDAGRPLAPSDVAKDQLSGFFKAQRLFSVDRSEVKVA